MNEETTSEKGVGTAYVTTSGTKPTQGINGQCALIRTVGWGAGNTAAGTASIVYNVSAGQLYLGKFKDVGETPDYGYQFTSRPSGIKFKAKYEAHKDDDFGSAEIRILDANDNILASNLIHIGTDVSDWSEIFLPLTYSIGAAKAAKIIIIFKSTAHEDGATRSYLKLSGLYGSGEESVGGQLYIDDIELTY